MPPVTLAMATSTSLQLGFVAFALSGLVAVMVHRAIRKHNKDKDGNSRFDSTGTWVFLAIITIPCGVILWAVLRFLWPIFVDWFNTL